MDDLLIASTMPEEHLQHLRSILECLSLHGIVINPVFGASEISFLGHHISQHSITPLPNKVQTIHDIPLPESDWKLQQFIGLMNFSQAPTSFW